MGTIRLIYVEWGSRHRSENLLSISRILDKARMPLGDVVIVDNSGELVEYSTSPLDCNKILVIKGQNSSREFSGWNCGVKQLLMAQPPEPGDVYLFVNDTFAPHRTRSTIRERAFANTIRQIGTINDAAMAGELFERSSPFSGIAGIFNSWLCTYAFAMNEKAIRVLMPLVEIESKAEAALTERLDQGLFRETVDSTYAAYLTEWLTESGKWRNAQPLSEESFSFLRLKAKSVLIEHAFTTWAREKNVKVLDIFECGLGRSSLIRRAARRLSRR